MVVAGWECLGGIRPEKARWYAVTLTTKNAAWAFSKGEPFRTIAALELFATLLSIKVFSKEWPRRSSGRLVITGATDNGGNPSVLPRMMTNKFPLVVILAELAEQLREEELDLDLFWVPREQNVEADALTNSCFEEFDVTRRIQVDPLALTWKVLPELLKVAEELYRKVSKAKEERTADKRKDGHSCSKGQKRLRERDPWR